MSKPRFNSNAFIFAPTSMAAQLSGLTGRACVFQRVPTATSQADGKVRVLNVHN